MTFDIWLTFVVASAALMLVPGPAMLFMMGTALNEGLGRSLSALPGIAVGLAVSISISLLGAGAVLLASAQLFTLLKLAGAAYLIYLGIRLWMAKPVDPAALQLPDRGKPSLFWPAFLVSTLNPKALIFYIAFLPQFVVASAPPTQQFVILGVTFCLTALAAAVISAMVGGVLRKGAGGARSLAVMNKCGAGAMVASGVITATAART